MNDINYIFNPYKQEFVLKNSEDGKYIEYLEKTCLTCKSTELFDQIRKKCVIKKKLNDIERSQIELCQNYLEIKRKNPPVDKKLIFNLLNIKLFNKTLSQLMDDFFGPGYIKGDDPKLNTSITSILTYIFNNWVKFSKVEIVYAFLKQLYNILVPSHSNLYYFFQVMISFISENSVKFASFFKLIPSVKYVISKLYTLFYEYSYYPLYVFKTAIYFILGSFEYYYRKFIPTDVLKKLDNGMINNITILFSKEDVKTVKVVVVNNQSEDIFDTIPNYKYFERGGLLIGLFDEKKQSNRRAVKYLKETVKNNVVNREVALKATGNFYKSLTVTDLELLKKYGIVSKDGTLFYYDRLGLQLKDPINQFKQLILYRTNEDANVWETGIMYIDNNNNQQIKSIYATAYARPLSDVYEKYFTSHITPYYKIIISELNILEESYKNTKLFLEKQSTFKNQIMQIHKYIYKLRENGGHIKNKQLIKEQYKIIKRIKRNYFNSGLFLIVDASKKGQKKPEEPRKQQTNKKTKPHKKAIQFIPKIISQEEIDLIDTTNLIKILKNLKNTIDNFVDNYSKFTRESQDFNRLLILNKNIQEFFSRVDLSKKKILDRYSPLITVDLSKTQSLKPETRNNMVPRNAIQFRENPTKETISPQTIKVIEPKMNESSSVTTSDNFIQRIENLTLTETEPDKRTNEMLDKFLGLEF